jgi:hypothetical protein
MISCFSYILGLHSPASDIHNDGRGRIDSTVSPGIDWQNRDRALARVQYFTPGTIIFQGRGYCSKCGFGGFMSRSRRYQLSYRKNGSDSNLWTHSLQLPPVNDSEWWGWSLFDILADAPEILIQYLFIKCRRGLLNLRQLYAKRPICDERGPKR